MSPMKSSVLVLCTGNSCRSQMAEEFLRLHGKGAFPVYSAGSEPEAEVHPLAVEVMAERGVDLAGKRPRDLKEYLGHVPVHTVIIVCDHAAKTCPAMWPGAHERLLWPFEDPARATGSEEEKRGVFRAVRDAIEGRIVSWLEEGGSALTTEAS